MYLLLIAARKCALIRCMCLFAVFNMRLFLTVIICTHAIFNSKIRLTKCCVPDWECFLRSPYLQEGMCPYYLQGPLSYTWRQERWLFCCMPSCRSSLSVCRAVGHPGQFGKCGMLLLMPSLQLMNTSRQIWHV